VEIQWPTTLLLVQPVEQRVRALVLLNTVVVMVLQADQQVEVLAHLPVLLLLGPTALGRTAGMLLLVVVMAGMVEMLDSLQVRALQDLLLVVVEVVPKKTPFPVTRMAGTAQPVA